MSTAPAVAMPSVTSLVSSLPQIPTPREAVMFILNAMIMASRTPGASAIRIYISKELTGEVTTLLAKLGVRFKTVPAEERIAPYLAIDLKGSYAVITVVDERGEVVREIRLDKVKFIKVLVSTLTALLRKRKGETEKEEQEETEYEEVIIEEDVAETIEKMIEKMD